MNRLRICSYNIHKGFSQFNRRMVVYDLLERLRALDADLMFLQEVQGLHTGHAQSEPDWPAMPQHRFLAHGVWPQVAYGGNAVYRQGHHGNALISKLPILEADNLDISLTRFERRGLLHCTLSLPDDRALHAICVHVSLTDSQRRRQLATLAELVQKLPASDPLIIAGDFNDWRGKATPWLTKRLGLQEVFTVLGGGPARSFPCRMPILTLDRIYTRGLRPIEARVLGGSEWSGISDHAPLVAELEYR